MVIVYSLFIAPMVTTILIGVLVPSLRLIDWLILSDPIGMPLTVIVAFALVLVALTLIDCAKYPMVAVYDD